MKTNYSEYYVFLTKSLNENIIKLVKLVFICFGWLILHLK